MEKTSRLNYIGGSDIVKLMGVSEHGNWTDVWKRFMYQENIPLDPEEKRDLLRGLAIEPHIEAYIRKHVDPTINDREQFERFDIENDIDDIFWNDLDGGNPWNGTTTETNGGARTQIFAQDRHQPYLRGHIDGVGERIWEFKAPSLSNIQYMNDYGVKEEYIVQCQFYMMITGHTRGAVVVWDYNNWEPSILHIRKSDHMHEQMRLITRRFWEALESGEPPSLRYQRKMGYLHLYEHDELDDELLTFYETREARKVLEKKEAEMKPRILTAVNAVWAEDEKTCQFITTNHKVRATRTNRGETQYVTLTVGTNEIKEKVPTRSFEE